MSEIVVGDIAEDRIIQLIKQDDQLNLPPIEPGVRDTKVGWSRYWRAKGVSMPQQRVTPGLDKAVESGLMKKVRAKCRNGEYWRSCEAYEIVKKPARK